VHYAPGTMSKDGMAGALGWRIRLFYRPNSGSAQRGML
jgi:hypothetical protein